jgi:hypothetical protein
VVQSFGMVVVLTTLLVLVVLNTATEHRLLGPDAALPTGATIAAAGPVGLSISGASTKPARSPGPAIVAGIGEDQWLYVIGPVVGRGWPLPSRPCAKGGRKARSKTPPKPRRTADGGRVAEPSRWSEGRCSERDRRGRGRWPSTRQPRSISLTE